MNTYDVVIVGGGPGGLAAALTLGRGRASALLVDGGTPRNARAVEMHNFVSRDGIPPREFRKIAREQIGRYPSIELREGFATRVAPRSAPDADGIAFVVEMKDEGGQPSEVGARKIILATGVRDELPDIPGLAALWGDSIFQCPYCHGWEFRDQHWGVLVPSEAIAAFAQILPNWASQVTAFTNGADLPDSAIASLEAAGLTVEREAIARLVGDKSLDGVELASGRVVRCRALVVRPPQSLVELVRDLDLARDDNGYVKTDPKKESSRPGLYVVGDATTMGQAAIFAAAEGTAAAAAINHALIAERLARKSAGAPR